MRGVGNRVGRGARSLEELAERLFTRVRFRRFRIRIAQRRFWLDGYINPWVPLANGEIRYFEASDLRRPDGSLLDDALQVGDDVIIDSTGEATSVLALTSNTPNPADLSRGAGQADLLNWPNPPTGYHWVYRRNGSPYLSRSSNVPPAYFDEVDQVFRQGHRPVASTAHLPDVSDSYRFWEETLSNGTTVKSASGRLGTPGQVRRHRNPSAQRTVSAGTGDDAGHLIGDRFGAPGGDINLSRQNRWGNQGGGTYHGIETRWDELIQDGYSIDIEFISDFTRSGAARPYNRKVRWTETDPSGSSVTTEIDFVNFETPMSRAAAGLDL